MKGGEILGQVINSRIT